MFSSAPMLRLRALVLARDARAVLRDWGERGTVQLTRSAPGPDTAPLAPRDRSVELARCRRLLARNAELRRLLGIPDANGRLAIGGSLESFSAAEQQFQSLELEAAALEERRQQLTARQAELNTMCDRLSPYRGLDVPLDGSDRFTFLHFATGSLPVANWAKLQEQIGAEAALLPLPDAGERQPLIVMTAQRNWPAQERALRLAGFDFEPLPKAAGATTESLAENSQREREQTAVALAQVNLALQEFAAKCLEPLGQIERRADTERRLLEAEMQFPRTEAAILLSGWIPAAEGRGWRERLLELSRGDCVLETRTPDPSEAEEPPVLLQQPRWLRPFGLLVRAYGLPQYRELEPTLFMAISYVLMFGVMFGDVGQGAVLAWGGLIVGRVARGMVGRALSARVPEGRYLEGRGGPPAEETQTTFERLGRTHFSLRLPWIRARGYSGWAASRPAMPTREAPRAAMLHDVGLLLLFCGLASMVGGWVYGSCFGLEWFKPFALWHDPLEGDPMRLMRFALGMGVVLISVGLVLNMINRFRRADVIGGLLDKFGLAGMVFYWGALAVVLQAAALESQGLLGIALIVFLALPLVGWVLKGPLEYFASRRAGRAPEPGASLVAAFAESFVGAFEAMLSYLANTISFVRLAAYAMSHAAMLAAAFAMAEELKHISLGGGWLAVLVIVLGNVVAIVLEGVVAAVQALRLEYYEFFGKFFSGGGQAFMPFRLTET